MKYVNGGGVAEQTHEHSGLHIHTKRKHTKLLNEVLQAVVRRKQGWNCKKYRQSKGCAVVE